MSHGEYEDEAEMVPHEEVCRWCGKPIEFRAFGPLGRVWVHRSSDDVVPCAGGAKWPVPAETRTVYEIIADAAKVPQGGQP